MLEHVKKLMISATSSLINSVLGLLFFVLIFGGPYLVYYVFPDPAYHITETCGFIALAISLLFLLLSIIKPVRPIAGTILVISSFVVAAFLWVWSVLIVGSTWGIGTVYVVNLFLGVGTVITAFAAALFTAKWSVLLQLFVISAISWAMRLLGIAIGSSNSSADSP